MPKGGEMKSGGLTGGIYKPLSSEQVELIHGEALRLLEEVGMGYESGQDDVLELVKHAGCRVDPAAMRIFFPTQLIEEMVAQAPGEITLYSRNGGNDLYLGKERVYAGTGGTTVQILDLDTGEVRQSMLKDIHNVARIVEEMKHIHFFQNCCAPNDVPLEHYDCNIAFAAMLGTRKHVMFGCSCEQLKFCTQSTANVRAAAELNVLTTVTSAPMSGSTAPMTMAGTLLQTHAEVLAGITVHQLTRPGAPVLYGGLPSMAEMRSMGYQGGGVECGMMQTAIHQLSQRVDVPNYASSGLSDSKITDAQAGWEKGLTTGLAVMGGNNYIHHAAGMLESMLSPPARTTWLLKPSVRSGRVATTCCPNIPFSTCAPSIFKATGSAIRAGVMHGSRKAVFRRATGPGPLPAPFSINPLNPRSILKSRSKFEANLIYSCDPSHLDTDMEAGPIFMDSSLPGCKLEEKIMPLITWNAQR
jgi:trimethylamine--corrinoid protein Co-methyltransferase